MGMFDYVNYRADCWKCGTPLAKFQSKDGPCELKILEPHDVDYFYSNCNSCNAWNEFHVERECVVKNIRQAG